MRGRLLSSGPAIFLVLAATLAALVLGGGNPAVAIAPAAAFLFLWVLCSAPLRALVLALFFLGVVLDSPQEQPAAGVWKSPLYPLAMLLFEPASKLTGIGALKFSGLDVLVAFAFALFLTRKAAGDERDFGDSVPSPKPLLFFAAVAFAALAGLFAWGVLRGGDVKNSLWQSRQLFFVPLLTVLFSAGLGGPRDLPVLGRMVVGAAVVKVFLGAYFLFVVMRPTGKTPPYVNTHSDSMLYVLALVVLVALWLERRTWANARVAMALAPILLVGLILNNRRLAWVSLAAALTAIYLVTPWNPFKRWVTRLAVLSVPLFFLYAAVGWNSPSRIFKPVAMIRSVVSSKTDRSTGTRDIENFNLTWTLRQAPLTGSGFGHEYWEMVKADDISKAFPQYRYIAHNSVLWLWTIGGLFGFSAVWMCFSVAVYFAARAYRHAGEPVHRAWALISISSVIVYAFQAYGDMGLQSWLGAFLVSMGMAVAGKLAVHVGAWPRGRPTQEAAPGKNELPLITLGHAA